MIVISTLINFNLSMVSNYTHYKVWDEITYPFPNFNGKFIPHFIMGVIPYPCRDKTSDHKYPRWENVCSICYAEGHRCLVRSHMDQTDIVWSGMDLIYCASLWILPLKFSNNQFNTSKPRQNGCHFANDSFTLKRLIPWSYHKRPKWAL